MNSNPTIVFTAPGKVTIEERPMPVPGNGELLIRTESTLISTGTELTLLSGDAPPGSGWAANTFPIVPGYDNIGRVIEVGPDVETSWIGKRVASYGSHAQFVVAQEAMTYPVGNEISNEHAAFFTIAGIVMNGVRRSQTQMGEAVVVFGLGLLGQLAVRFCHLSGARPVFGVDMADARLQRLPQTPGIIPVNAKQHDVKSLVEAKTSGRMADVIFEVTGDAAGIPDEFKVLRPQGRAVILSSPRGATSFDFHDLCNGPSFTIIGAHNNSHPWPGTTVDKWTRARHAELFFQMVQDGDLDMEPLISHRERFYEATRLYQMLLEGRSTAMGVILDWSF